MAKNTNRETFLLFSLLLLIASCESQVTFDYLQVVMQWQPATCTDSRIRGCTRAPENRLSIHGVWPSLRSGAIVGPCNGAAFDATQVVTIRAGLNENWPDVISRSNQAFWREEWRKHGTCSGFNQLQYFAFGLNTYAFPGRDIIEILRRARITPNGNRYSKTSIVNAINNSIGRRPGLRCNYDRSTNRRQLHEFSLCYSINTPTLTLMDCPSSASTCPANFKWSSYRRSANTVDEVDGEVKVAVE